MCEHGHSRGHHYQDDDGNRYSSPFGAAAIVSVCERWCSTCRKWVEVRGVTGELRFMAEHAHDV